MVHRTAGRRRVILIAAIGLAIITATVAIGGWGYLTSVDNAVRRMDAFGPTPDGSRPPAVALEALNILVMGADKRATDDYQGNARADSIILVHVPADRKSAQFISIPRDTWLLVPPTADGNGGTTAKINAAFAWGQAPLMVRTVESFTGVRIDHTVTVNFNGFERIINALGGIDIVVDTTFRSIHVPYRNFTAGSAHMDGATALDYARQREQFADGDFTRMRHQRDILGAVFEKASQLSITDGPARLDSVIRSTAAAVTVDETLSIFDMVRLMRDMRRGDFTMLTSPSAGTGMVGEESVVFADMAAASELYQAVRTDTMNRWLASHKAV
jgi:LCP family protein required for cell wall assembly